MKIVHIIQFFEDNFGWQENILPQYHSTLNNQVIIITSDKKRVYKGLKINIKQQRIYNIKKVKIIRLPVYLQVKNNFVIFKNLYQILCKEQPDIIFHHEIAKPSLWVCIKYKKKYKNVKILTDSHGDFYNTAKTFLSKHIYHNIWAIILKYWIKYIDIIYAVAPSCVYFLRNKYLINNNKVKYLQLGIDTQKLKYDEKSRSLIRNKYHLLENDFVILTSGKIGPDKKVEVLLQFMKLNDSPNIKLLIVGNVQNKYKKYLDSIYKNDNRVKYCGWIEFNDIYKFYSAADIGIYPGGQSVLWQASIGCNLPIIVYYGKDKEYLIDKGCGLFFFSYNPKELNQIVNIIINNPSLLVKLRKRCKKITNDFLSYEKIAKKSITF